MATRSQPRHPADEEYDRHRFERAIVEGFANQEERVEANVLKFGPSMALAIYLLVGTPPLSAQPSGQYFDAERARVQKLLNLRLRKQIEADCKAKAKKLYTAVHFLRRRAYVKDCIEHSLVPLRRGLMGFIRPGAPTTVTCSLLLSQPCVEGQQAASKPSRVDYF